jgi:hypothetical protein
MLTVYVQHSRDLLYMPTEEIFGLFSQVLDVEDCYVKIRKEQVGDLYSMGFSTSSDTGIDSRSLLM